MSLRYSDYDLAGIDLGLQPAIDLRNLGIAHNLLSGEHMHHATIDGADGDFLRFALGVFALGDFFRFFSVVGHTNAFGWEFVRIMRGY